jgi:hypothetical protein
MGFFTGRVTFLRYPVDGPAPDIFGLEQLARLADHALGKHGGADKDGTEVGWVAGDDILDTGFDLAKNVVNDALHFALRVDTRKLPADLLRAYARAELQALAAGNPSGRPSAKQKKEAKEAARERLEAEAADGRFNRRKAYPVLWDRPSNTLLVGTQSLSVMGRLQGLFKDTPSASPSPCATPADVLRTTPTVTPVTPSAPSGPRRSSLPARRPRSRGRRTPRPRPTWATSSCSGSGSCSKPRGTPWRWPTGPM